MKIHRFWAIAAAGIVFCSGRTAAAPAMEPFTSRETFETRSLNAWSSYPLWQDTAYDDNFTVGTIVPGDPNLSIVQMVNAYESGDVYAGAQKKMDFYLAPGFRLSADIYLKTHLPVESVTVRIACGPLGKIDRVVKAPRTNRWTKVSLAFEDFTAANPALKGKAPVRAYGIAFLVKAPDADPAMPFWLGIDNITVETLRDAEFRFIRPEVAVLPEWKERIAATPLRRGEPLVIRGEWPMTADRVRLAVTSFADTAKTVAEAPLAKSGTEWALDGLPLALDRGIYRGTLTAFRGSERVGETRFTFTVAPEGIGGKHPRLWFDSAGRDRIRVKLKEPRYAGVAKEIAGESARMRKDFPLARMVYDFDQFPDEDWLVTRYAWSRNRITLVGESVYWNALAWSLLGDRAAGDYAKDALLAYSAFPTWNHPWMKKNGRPFYLLMGDMAMYFALGYDLAYDLMTDGERKAVRVAFMREVIRPAHEGYVVANMVTTHTSNWVAAIMGGSLMCQAAVWGDGPDVPHTEPFLTGAALKDDALVHHATGRDGGYGEGYNYYHYSSRSWSKSLPALENVFGVDLSARLAGVYDEFAWAGRPTEKETFSFGDSRGALQPMEGWAWLIPKYHDPLLAWLYRLTNSSGGKTMETKSVTGFATFSAGGAPLFTVTQGLNLMDLVYDTEGTAPKAPFDRPPVRLFRDIGTTVFKGGWKPDDFIFVLRTGPFYNHQHLDQGTFFLADRGSLFIGERTGSAYYDDPLYESRYTKPIAHSTILIDRMSQSQRTGDPLDHIQGLDDHAFVSHFLDGSIAAFVTGDIGRLYWGKVKSLERNVLYLKPRTLLMLDTAVPAERDREISLLLQADRLKNIAAGKGRSTVSVGNNTLHILHLAPARAEAEAVETPHYLTALNAPGPLEKEGMLTVSARTEGMRPLVTANLLVTTPAGETPDASCRAGDGFAAGKAGGLDFAFSTEPGRVFTAGGITTDACAIAWKDGVVFAAKCTELVRDGRMLVKSSVPVTCEISGNTVKYYLHTAGEAAFGTVKMSLPAGEETVKIK